MVVVDLCCMVVEKGFLWVFGVLDDHSTTEVTPCTKVCITSVVEHETVLL